LSENGNASQLGFAASAASIAVDTEAASAFPKLATTSECEAGFGCDDVDFPLD